MDVAGSTLSWIVCHRVTRSITRSSVRCPLRGRVTGDACLDCRFLTASSIEREAPSWCEIGPAVLIHTRAARPARVPIPVIRVRPSSWPMRLPVLVPGGAVSHPEAVPSGHGFGT